MSSKKQDHITFDPKAVLSSITDADIQEWRKKYPDLDIRRELENGIRRVFGLPLRAQQEVAKNPRGYLEECLWLMNDDTEWETISTHQEYSRPETPEEFVEYVKYFLLMRWPFFVDDEPPKLRKKEFSSLKYYSKKCLKKTMVQGFPTWPRDPIQAYSDVEDWLEQFRQINPDEVPGDEPKEAEPEKKPQPKKKKASSRRRSTTVRPLTELQRQALQLWGEHNGKVKLIAEAMNISSPTVTQHLQAAWKKIPHLAPKKTKGTHRATRLPTDRRGQVTVTDGADSSE